MSGMNHDYESSKGIVAAKPNYWLEDSSGRMTENIWLGQVRESRSFYRSPWFAGSSCFCNDRVVTDIEK